MKTTMTTILAVLIIQAVQAADVLRRQRRDLIGYNRQQNNVLGHIRYIEGENEDKRDMARQILEFMSKRRNVNATKMLEQKNSKRSNRSSRYNRFRRYHN